jgi:adenine-specific DNA-methyltransferase
VIEPVRIGDAVLYLGDCLEVLPTLAAGSVDAVMTDPPYNVGKRYGASGDNRSDYASWCGLWIGASARAVRQGGIIAVKNIVRHLPLMFAELEQHGTLVNQIIWQNVAASNGKRSFWNAYESILVYAHGDGHTFNTYAQTRQNSKPSWSKQRRARERGQMTDMWTDIVHVYTGSVQHHEAVMAGDGTKRKVHPCQQPIGLSSRLIEFLTNDGDTVLDPFMGLGTTGVASVSLRRKFVGVEIEERYFNIAVKRIEAAQAQLRMDI